MAETRHGVTYDFNFFSHGWSRYFTLYATTLCKMTCNCIWGTEIAFEITEQKYNIVYAQKCFYVISEFYSFLHQGWANFSVAKKSNFTENCVGRRQGSEFRGIQYLIKKLITFQGLQPNSRTFKTTTKIQDLFKIVRTMDKGGQGLRSVEQE